ncbi:5-oxoprolinase [Salinisphaera orenii MK-B5]|uniref:5-oxoprolinase n=1 Tax=Salinisphaera orenii MK-B5 TaxID=856730 RepID=A0A423PU20_9GAMM|nr:hydantoinase B/oxoprolinase family protein [Salinisphaera orenii]ROO29022.1 5-oxoprolinase [Salinisphaera orenii MK-B5]
MTCPADTRGHDAIELAVFASRITAVCEEMGARLAQAAFSPNIRDRLDYSCAVFDAAGRLCAQAAHIPVHLGSMAYAMADIVAAREWRPGEMVALNDPYLGGTHLPDVTLIAPLFVGDRIAAFVVNRAHHADIGADSPGSMPLSTDLAEEGLVIAPVALVREDAIDESVLGGWLTRLRNPDIARGDFSAQIAANRVGMARLAALVDEYPDVDAFEGRLADYNGYARQLAAGALAALPDGRYRFTDYLDDDGQGSTDLAIACCIDVEGSRVHVDFAGSSPMVAGNVNCPLSVTAAGVLYALRCLMPAQLPACAGAFDDISLSVPERSLLNARAPHAVAAGNVETSQRVVDAVLGAIADAVPERVPAASHGSMNNVALGSHADESPWDYYETMGGGLGAGPQRPGASAVQAHMTNTLNTPVEVLERHFPMRVTRYAVRRGSGGAGARAGGDGIERELMFLAATDYTLLTERRRRAPWGRAGGGDGARGENRLDERSLPGKCTGTAQPRQRLRITSAGGGGHGPPS